MGSRRPTRGGVLDRGLRTIIAVVLAASGFEAVAGALPPLAAAATGPPAFVQAQGLSGALVTIFWTPVAGATSYNVYRDGSGTKQGSTTGTRYTDAVNALSTHTYRVTAVAGSESALSAAATATAQAATETSPPTTPGPITASSLTSSSVKLSWGSSTDNVGIEGYRVLRGPTLSQLVDISTTDAVTSYSAINLRANTTYVFGVQALDAANHVSSVRTITITTKTSSDSTKPSAPVSITTRVFSSSRIDLYWSTSSSSDVSGYQVLRNGAVVGQVDLPGRLTFSDTGLASMTTYAYTVKAIDWAGNASNASGVRSATTLSAGTVIVVRGPYVQSVSGTSAKVAWWTNIKTEGVVTCPACPQMTSVDHASAYEHLVLLGGLTAGTSYAYTVGDGNVTATGTFVTAAAPGTNFSFAAIGDFGGGSAGESGNATRIALDGTAFIQTLGDNVYPEAADPSFATVYSDYDARFYRQFGAALAQKTLWAANGNKEYYGNGAWFVHMWQPNNERWYSYDWGNAHILVLDTEQVYAPGSPQYAFAQSDLAAHQGSRWRIVALQRPAYSSTSANSSSAPVRANLVSLFEAQQVQLVLSGNSHNSERTFPLLSNGNPNNPVVDPAGVTYVVSGNGGNGFNAFTVSQPSWSAYRQATTYGYLRVDVTPTSLTVEALSSTGAVLDTATITGSTDSQPPAAPAGLGGSAVSSSEVDLSWTAATDNVGVTGYFVYRNGVKMQTLGAATSTIDSLVLPTTTYNYTVAAFDAAGNVGPPSNSVIVTTPPGSGPIFSDGFESGDLSRWTAIGGLNPEASIVHSGTFAAEGKTTTGATYAKKLLPSTYASGFARAYVDVVSASSQVNLLRLRTAADGSIGYLYVTAAGMLGLRDDAGGVTLSSTTSLTFGTWHSLEVHFTINGISGASEVWLDGNPVADLTTTLDLGTTNIGKIQIGEVLSGRTYDVIFDDIVFSASAIGP